MNEETTIPTEMSASPEAASPIESTVPESTETFDWSLMFEDPTEETTAEVVITLDDLHSVGSDMMHADLFGSFLICGTLIGLFLLRGIHGT